MSVARGNITSPSVSAAPLRHAIFCWRRALTLRGFGLCLMAKSALLFKVRMSLPGQKIAGLQQSLIKSRDDLKMWCSLNDLERGASGSSFCA